MKTGRGAERTFCSIIVPPPPVASGFFSTSLLPPAEPSMSRRILDAGACMRSRVAQRRRPEPEPS